MVLLLTTHQLSKRQLSPTSVTMTTMTSLPLIVFWCVVSSNTLALTQADASTPPQEWVAKMMARLESVEKKNQELYQENQGLRHEVVGLTNRINQFESNTKNDLSQIRSNVTKLQSSVDSQGRAYRLAVHTPGTLNQFTGFSCTGDSVQLSCPDDREILLVSGFYGQSLQEGGCGDCCQPNPALDCTDSIDENRPSDWLTMKALCDNQRSCSIDNLGSVIDRCESGYTSDYMQLFFECLPQDATGAVAFMASAETGDSTPYNEDGIIVFDEVITNAGGHYSADTSSFICPWDGVYVISVHVQASTSTSPSIGLMQNTVQQAEIRIDGNSRGSTTIVVQALAGDVIWVKAGSVGSIYAIDTNTLFTGFLLQQD